MKLQKVNNANFEDEYALINVDTKEVIIKGDYYHDKINEYIEGFLHGLMYSNVKYELLDTIEATPDMELFKICDFYNNDYYEETDWDDEFEESEDDLESSNISPSTETLKNPEFKEEASRPLYEVKHHFEIIDELETSIYCNIIEALEKTRKKEADLYLTDNKSFSIVYSCLGLEPEDNNRLLKEFGVYYDEHNKLQIIDN